MKTPDSRVFFACLKVWEYGTLCWDEREKIRCLSNFILMNIWILPMI